MPIIENKEQYGLMLWGTKLGAQVFVKSNIKTDEKLPLEDLRAYFHFDKNKTRASLFGYNALEYCHAYTLYTPLLDWRNRDGFLAVSILLDNSRQAPLEQIPDLLHALTDLYKNKYFNEKDKKIEEYVREALEPFRAVLDQAEYAPTALKASKSAQGSQGFMYCKNSEELKKYAAWLHPVLQPDIRSFFLLEEGDGSFADGDIKALQLQAPKAKMDLTLRLKTKSGGAEVSAHQNLNFEVRFRSTNKTERLVSTAGAFEIAGVNRDEKLEIKLLPNDYYQDETFPTVEVERCAGGEKVLFLSKWLNLDIEYPDLASAAGLSVQIQSPAGNQTLPLRQGKCRAERLYAGRRLTIFFEGNADFEAKRTVVDDLDERTGSKTICLSRKTAPKQPDHYNKPIIKNPETPKQPDKGFDVKKIAFVGIGLVLVVVVLFLMTGGDSYAEKCKEVEAKIAQAERPDWLFHKPFADSLNASLDSLLRNQASCSQDLKFRWDKASKLGMFRLDSLCAEWAENWESRYRDMEKQAQTLKTDQNRLKGYIDSLSAAVPADIAQETRCSSADQVRNNFQKTLDFLRKTTLSDKTPDTTKNKAKPEVDHEAEAAKILKDATFALRKKAVDTKNALAAQKNKDHAVLTTKLTQYIAVCDNFALADALLKCAKAEEDKSNIVNAFACTDKDGKKTSKTINDFRTENYNFREGAKKLAWTDEKQIAVIKKKWEDLKAELSALNPNQQW